MLTSAISIFLLTVLIAHADLEQLAQRIDETAVPSHMCDSEAGTHFKSPAPMFEGFPFDLARHACLFEPEYIIAGASVSTGEDTSPMNVLAQASNTSGKLRLIAQPGSPSHRHMAAILSADTRKIRTVFAYDLFFWDSQGDDERCRNSIGNVKRLLDWAQRNKVNLILGNIPGGGQDCVDRLNAAMEDCEKSEFCTLVDNKSKWSEIKANGGIRVGDEFFTPRDLRPDGLHFSRTGAIIAAELIAASIDAKKKNCP